jgi:hypothetical protein
LSATNEYQGEGNRPAQNSQDVLPLSECTFFSALSATSVTELETKRLLLHEIDTKEVHYSLARVGEGLSYFKRAALRKHFKKFGIIRVLRRSKKKRILEIVCER